MIPRLHKRGQSFKGACSYILHDAGTTTADRVAWTLTRNLSTRDPKWAWHEMYETFCAQEQLKAASGQDRRGRKNTRPVLHYTLSWASSENPSPEHMQQAALASLKAMGLDEHEAQIAAHTDKQHMHVHIVVNTVHPQTGMTAPMKFTKLALSRWAESYEREYGIHCDERIKNNEERRRLAAERERQPTALLMAASHHDDRLRRRPYVPVKHRAVQRKQWFDRKEIVERMRAMRGQLDAELKIARQASWARQSQERDELDARTQSAIDHARGHMSERFRPQWRDLYRAQKKEERHVGRIADRMLDRAAFVYAQRERLGKGSPLTMRQMVRLIRSGDALAKRLSQVHEQERRTLARGQKAETKVLTDRIWEVHRARFDALRERQAAERQAEREQQGTQRKGISFAMAKASLMTEQEDAPPPPPEPRPIKRDPENAPLRERFGNSAKPSRSEQIRRDMEQWRKKNDGRDFGREM